MKNRFFALLLIGWHSQGLAMVDIPGVVNFALPASQFYSITDKESPFIKLAELKGSALSTQDAQQARISYNMLRSLRAIRSFIEDVSSEWPNAVDKARIGPLYEDKKLDEISNQLAKIAGIDPQEKAPLVNLREAVLNGFELKGGMQTGASITLTDLMNLEAYFGTGNQKETDAIDALKNTFAGATTLLDIDGMIAEARAAQKIDLPALYQKFIDGDFAIVADPINPQFPEFLGAAKRTKIFDMLSTGEEVEAINQYALPLIYADEGFIFIKSKTANKPTPYIIPKDLTAQLANFDVFKVLEKPQTKASAFLRNFLNEIEDFIKNDIGQLIANPKASSEKAKKDQLYINAYLEGLLVHMVNKYTIKDPTIEAKILDRWDAKKLALMGDLKKTTLYAAVSKEALTAQLTELGMALMTLESAS